MRAFAILLLVALANARPEAPGGYHYQQPSLPIIPVQTQQIPQRIPTISNSYGTPVSGNGLGFSSGGHFTQSSNDIGSGSFIGSSNGFGSNGGYVSGSHGFSSSGSNGFSSGISNGGLSGGLSGGASITQSFGGFATGNSLHSGGFVNGGGVSSDIGFGGSIGSSSSSFGTGISQVQQQAPIVQKHIYVHVPPPEPVEEQQRFLSAAAPRTNYKIIFIKAPTAPAVSPAIIQQQQQSQEKTIVYVLVKKPDEQESLVLSGLAPTKPSKPEVYFIKYQARKEAGGGGSLNVGASDVSGHADIGISGGIGLGNGGGIGLGNGGGISLGNGGGISVGHGGGNGGGIQLNTGSTSSLSTEYGVPRNGGYN